MVSIIVAVAQNGTIGDKNSLLWHIKEDMRFFRTTTSGHAVIMGRKTFESLGSKPLPKRTNIVITRQDVEFEGALTAHSLEEAIRMAEGDEEVFIIGGAQIYAQALECADRLYLTLVERDYEGDTSFPEIDYRYWQLVAEERHERGEEFESPFSFLTFDRVKL
ncbi:MAG: dihydrofolate reductase [Alistipes sp.]|jgi:dihydrofolate reductase|nr:dihydrofolate reductase [Alistipes sp.]MBO7265487.1 dihydrofolate reductase [Alistipes sp.]